MLLRADPATKTLSLMSFPRDLVVPIHCPGKPVYTRSHQRRLLGLRLDRLLRDDPRAHAHPDQLPDHGQLPGLPPGRRPARRRLDRRRPPALQRQPEHDRDRLREHRPAPGLPEADRPAGTRLRALPPHRLRPLPGRAPAAVREGREAAAEPVLGVQAAAPDRGGRAQHADRRGGREGDRRRHAPQVRELPLRPPAGALLPAEDREPDGDGARQRRARRVAPGDPDGRLGVPAPRRLRLRHRDERRARAQAEAQARPAAVAGHGHRVERQRRQRLRHQRGLRAPAARLPDRAPAEPEARERADLELLPLEGLLPARGRRGRGRGEGDREGVRLGRRAAAPGEPRDAFERRRRDRRRRPDLPRRPRPRGGRPDAEAPGADRGHQPGHDAAAAPRAPPPRPVPARGAGRARQPLDPHLPRAGAHLQAEQGPQGCPPLVLDGHERRLLGRRGDRLERRADPRTARTRA